MGLFGIGDNTPSPPPKPQDAVDKLIDAVTKNDAVTAHKLLEDAGGMCKAIQMAQAANSRSYKWSDDSKEVIFSLGTDGDKERIALIHQKYKTASEVAFIVLPRCND